MAPSRRQAATAAKPALKSIRGGKNAGPHEKSRSGELLLENAVIPVGKLAVGLGITKGQLAETIGMRPETLNRTTRANSVKTQARVREMLEIISRITGWAGGEQQALAWYRAYPIPAFGGRTAEALVKEGRAASVRDYIDQIATGGFA
jgi:hypothetical protein